MTTMAKPILTTFLVLLLAGLVALGLLTFYSVASADPGVVPAPLVGSGSGSSLGSGSGTDAVSSAAPITPPPQSLIDEVKELRAKYEAASSSKDKDTKVLLWAGLIAALLKVVLSVVNRLSGSKPKKWLAWVAMGLAVPIALLSHYALGHSVFDSLIYAGAGPGAIIVHELLKVFMPEAKPAPEPAK